MSTICMFNLVGVEIYEISSGLLVDLIFKVLGRIGIGKLGGPNSLEEESSPRSWARSPPKDLHHRFLCSIRIMFRLQEIQTKAWPRCTMTQIWRGLCSAVEFDRLMMMMMLLSHNPFKCGSLTTLRVCVVCAHSLCIPFPFRRHPEG